MINFVKKYFNSKVVFLEDRQFMFTIMQMINYWTRIKKQTSLHVIQLYYGYQYTILMRKPEVCVYIKIHIKMVTLNTILSFQKQTKNYGLNNILISDPDILINLNKKIKS